ncbi:ABC transporter substrate-binding protein [Candidatus Nitrotoga sp. 1052]|uniref:ABC transporter substrate-binding protein n=1 Tax=Candidatus Nitrotoga sp. 1052 TaxID=2886964 RepID=UPI001EF4043E|nr:ABC transporter substrate-binding protein [Candidatus Nitrotoga sp. 1052]CAH1078537.1 Urea ABC transporter, urea binding protein [Candidatus Nitrotoga sp. 1052]
MKVSQKILIALVLMSILLITTFMAWRQYSVAAPSIRIGVLHSLSGSMATSEKPLVDALQLAIEEANATDGIQGQKIEAVVVDCRSDPTYCAQQAERLITKEKVKVLFGCWTSACRKAVKPVVEKYQHLLFYPVQYEGMEQSPNIIYTGAAPNQQIIPAVLWALNELGKRVYLAGSDYVFPRTVNIIIKDILAAQGAVLAGERYLPLGEIAMDELVSDIVKQRPDMVLNTITGDSNIAFFRALDKAGITADKIPVLSFSIAEVELVAKHALMMAGHYTAWGYFQSIQSPQNQAFVQRFRDRFGQQAVLDDPMEASYIGLHLWVQAAREAGSAEPAQVQRTILRQSLLAPEGVVSLDPATRHLWKMARIGKVRSDGQFDIVWDSGRPLEPAPFPAYRSREEWNQLLQNVEGMKP